MDQVARGNGVPARSSSPCVCVPIQPHTMPHAAWRTGRRVSSRSLEPYCLHVHIQQTCPQEDVEDVPVAVSKLIGVQYLGLKR